jgi:hypothetical protein
MADAKKMRPGAVVGIATVAGLLVAGLLALLTFGAQATAKPDGLPVAVAVPSEGPAAAPLTQAAQQVAARAGDQLDVTITSPEDARNLLEDKEIYGILELAAGPTGPQATVVTSGAINPSGTQIAQLTLTRAGDALTSAIAQQQPGLTVSPVQFEQLHEVTAAGRTAPLAVSALLWVGCMVAGAALTVLAMRSGNHVGAISRIAAGIGVSVLLAALMAGFLWLWDSSLPLDDWRVYGLILLAALAFITLQGGLFHLMGIAAMAIIGPLYLIAPAVAGQVPELLHPAYRDALWSWTPFRFPTEALRSVLAGTPEAPDVMLGVWVLAGMAVLGLLLLAIPRRSAGQVAEADAPDGVVDVGVDQAERLPSTQR